MKGKKTGGRTRGVKNKSCSEIKTLLDSNVDFNLVVKKLFELTQGVKVQKGEGYYLMPPDAQAAKILLEYRFGKAMQQMDVTSDGKAIKAPVINVISTDDSES